MNQQLDQRKVHALWVKLNTLSIQVSEVREEFARMISQPGPPTETQIDMTDVLIKPVKAKRKR